MAVITSIEDLRILARRRVPRMFYDYVDSGSWTESTYRANASDFARIKFRQRVAINLENRTLKTTMVGQETAMPVALAPTGLTGMQRADGEILAARAAEKFGVPFTLSTVSICSIEDIAENTKKPFWFQLYVMKDRKFIESLINRAKAASCSALELTLADDETNWWAPNAAGVEAMARSAGLEPVSQPAHEIWICRPGAQFEHAAELESAARAVGGDR